MHRVGQRIVFRSLKRISKCWIIATALLGIYLLSKLLLNSYARCEEQPAKAEPDVVGLLTSPFVKDQPKLVVLLSYQRSGSSFVGEWFNTNPDVFFNFEPVDSLYSAMYGTPQNTNVPSDITNYPNGSIRILPEEELKAVSNFLLQFLNCDVGSLPTQALINYYFISSYRKFNVAANYTKCLRETFKLFRRCESFLSGFCGSRFGKAPEANQRECFRRKWLNESVPINESVNKNTKLFFSKHRSCVESQRALLKTKCQHLLLGVCTNHQIRVIKTVRATMESMEPLLRMFPNFRVIHLVRDPRAVALSRNRFGGHVRGIYSGNDTDTVTKESKLYCSTVVRDIKTRQRLELEYPGKIHFLLFDELITNAELYLEQVYEFLEMESSDSVANWLSTQGRKNSKTNKTSMEIAKQWENVISIRTNQEIIENCREFFQLIPYKWAT